ncbi:MAG: nucleotide sugar dehydrogenase [Thermodesulfobacteriota bacterium]
MNISIIGTSYVGLITGACFAEIGNNVICVDIDREKFKGLGDDRSPLTEPGFVELIIKNLKEGRLSFTTDIHQAVKNSFIIFITVGTRVYNDGNVDTTAILRVSRSIGKSLDDYKIIVIKSTVPLGTTEMVREIIREFTDVEFDVAYNPEFLNEGSAIEDFMKPDRIVIGFDKPSVARIIKGLYSPFMNSSDGFILAPIKSAELATYEGMQYFQREFHL